MYWYNSQTQLWIFSRTLFGLSRAHFFQFFTGTEFSFTDTNSRKFSRALFFHGHFFWFFSRVELRFSREKKTLPRGEVICDHNFFCCCHFPNRKLALKFWNFKADFRGGKWQKIIKVTNDLSSSHKLRKVFKKNCRIMRF